MEALILTLPTLILLALPMLLLAFVGMEVAELLSKIESREKQKAKKTEPCKGQRLFFRAESLWAIV